jgi:multiple sugar transport system permease protein
MTTLGILPRWWITAAALTISAILLSPFYWVLVGSFMTPAELFGGHMSLWPKHFVIENWSVALSRLWPHIQNSLLVSAVASVGTLLITAPAAYGLVWRKPLGRQTLLAFMLMTQMLPAIVFVIPLFIVFTQINLVNTLGGLILADMTFTVPFALIMLSAYMKDLPYELVEAALVDGAGQLRAFMMIVLPMTLPGLITVGVFSFLIPWGDLIFALSLITDASLQPLTLELYKAFGQYGIDWGFLLPGSVLTAIPAVIFVIAASRFIVAGVTRGAIK